jgi:hypothetical protein
LNPDAVPQFIATLLTPMLMVSGAASMIWGLQRLQFAIVNRLRALDDERLELQQSPTRDVLAEARLVQISEQVRSVARRARYTRNSIASFYVATLAFFACSISIAVVGWFGLPAAWVCTLWFEAGMVALYVALGFTLADVWLSYRAVEVDTQL